MKITVVTLTLALGLCLGFMAYQHHRYAAQFDRQNQAIALVQSRYETSQQENQKLRMAMEAKSRARAALLQAVPISARYQKTPPAKPTAAR